MFQLYSRGGKRLVDLALAVPLLLIASPVMAIVAALIRWRLGPPVMFRQQRPGRDGTPFTILKFRTMTDTRGADGRLLPDAQRLTRLGRMLRRTTLDELPELVNVVRGQMSLVGPRPLLMDYLTRYSAEQARRHEVRPGLTGWAQINGRNAATWDAKFAYDVWYVDHLSFWIDLKILLRTLSVVLRCAGVNNPGHETMPRFEGSSHTTCA